METFDTIQYCIGHQTKQEDGHYQLEVTASVSKEFFMDYLTIRAIHGYPLVIKRINNAVVMED